ncbi:MAG: NAD(P)-dependent alcohol dehydrogenase [Anaerolineae bacterium]|jgi:NADPH:quinone reductase-like Zn-dependent oxidoreductase
MKAIVWTKYGLPDGLELREVEKPTPKDDQVLIRIYATTVTAGDCEMRSLDFPLLLRLAMRLYVGLTRPKRVTILGQELAGQIEAVGKDVKRFKPGDQVFAGIGFGFGAYAEYVCLPEASDMDVLVTKPANMSYEEAAAVPVGGLNALHFIREAKIRSGQKVLINGAGGSIGTIAIQLTKSSGAQVTAVDSAAKLDMLRAIGADQVIDYAQQDFTESGETYDAIFDVVGKASFPGCMRSLAEGGIYLLGNPALSRTVRGRWISMTSGKRIFAQTASYKTEDLVFLKERIEEGKVRAVIDRRFPLEQMAEAHRYVEGGGKKGNVVITVGGDDNV